MVSLSQVVQYMFPGAKPLVDFVVADNGTGPYIQTWNLAAAQPTQAEIDAATPSAEAALAVAVAELEQEKLDRKELRDRFISIRDGLNTIIATPSFTATTRDAAIIELAKDVRFLLKAVKGLL